MGKHFGAFWGMPPGLSPSIADQGNIYFRDPLPIEEASAPVLPDVRTADVGETTLGLASSNKFIRDINTARGWAAKPTPAENRELLTLRGKRRGLDFHPALEPKAAYVKQQAPDRLLDEMLTSATGNSPEDAVDALFALLASNGKSLFDALSNM